MLKIISLFWILTCIYGNEFLKLNIFKGINPLYMLMGICILYMFFVFNSKRYVNDDKKWIKYKNIFSLFIFYTFLIIILSFFNYIKLFNIQGLEFDRSFIIRQAYFIFTVPIGIVIFDYVNKSDILEKLKLKFLIGIFLILCISKFMNIFDVVPFRVLILIISSFVYFNKNKKIGIILIIISILFRFDGSTSIICYMILIISLFDWKKTSVFFKKYLGVIIYFGVIFLIFGTVLFYDNIVEILYKDPNAIWRWQYWINELRILIETKFLGVGFGTAYASNSIFTEIYNPNAFAVPDDGFGYNISQVLFLTSQHNSILNMFYRLGVIGGGLFIYINYFPIKWYLGLMLKLDKEKQKMLKWSFVNFIISIVIISLNPGIESPRFFISYLIMFSIFISLLYKYSNDYNNGINRGGAEYEK